VNTEGQSGAAKILARDERNDLAHLTSPKLFTGLVLSVLVLARRMVVPIQIPRNQGQGPLA
jgi:hypothetical protein